MPFQDVKGNLHSNIGEAISANIGFLGRVEGGKIQPPEVSGPQKQVTLSATPPKDPAAGIISKPGFSPGLVVGAKGDESLSKAYKARLPAYVEVQKLLDKGIVSNKVNYYNPQTGQWELVMTSEQVIFRNQLVQLKSAAKMPLDWPLSKGELTKLFAGQSVEIPKPPPPAPIPVSDKPIGLEIKELEKGKKIQSLTIYEVFEIKD